MIMTRLILVVSLILLWTKDVKANPLHYTLRYRESTERQSKVAADGGKHKGFSSTPKRRSLQGEDRSREYLEPCSGSGKAGKGKGGKGGKGGKRRFLQDPCMDDFSIPSDSPTPAVVLVVQDNDEELSNEGFESEEPSNDGVEDRSQFQGGDPIVGIPLGDDDDGGTDDGELTNEDYVEISNDAE